MNENERVAIAKESKTPNVRVAMKLGIPIEWKDRGMVADGTQMWPYVAGTKNLIPDYVGDIAAAMTLVPEDGVVSFARMNGVWAVAWERAAARGLPLSAAIVDAFLAGGE